MPHQLEVKSPLKHDGTLYQVGDFVEASADEFAQLVADGVLAPVGYSPEKAEAPKEPEAPQPEENKNTNTNEGATTEAEKTEDKPAAVPLKPYETPAAQTGDLAANL